MEAWESRSTALSVAERLIHVWALFGGGLMLLVVLMNVLSVLGGVFWVPFPGDFELTQVGVAVSVFMFLPYCELSGANVTADIFTQRAAPRWIACFKIAAATLAFLFACLLFWRMGAGMLSQRQYGYETAIVQFPIWIAFLPILGSIILLALAALISLRAAVRRQQP